MKPIINHLVQLQELIEIRAQNETAMPNNATHLTELDAAIRTLIDELPDQISRQFTRLQKKGHVGIVPINQDACSGCGMKLPVSLMHSVRAGKELHTCPNCARMLYAPSDAAPRRVNAASRRMGQRKVGINRFSSPELMLPHISASTRDEMLQEVCEKLEKEGFVDSAERLLEEALRREAILSTAVDHGLAFPHVRGVEGGGLTLALATTRKGVKFDEGRNLTRLIFFVVIPTAASAFYLKLLSGLTQSFRDKTTRDKLLKADKPEALWKTLVSATRTTIR